MSDEQNTPSDPDKDSPDRPDGPPNVIDYALSAPALENIERDRSVMREPEESLGAAIQRRFAPLGGIALPESPDQPMREPPDFSGPDYAWLETEEGGAALAERFRRLFRREDDDA